MFKMIKIFTLLFVLYLLAGFFLVPNILLPKLQDILNEQLNAKVSLTKLSINPLTFSLRLSGITLYDKKQNNSIVELDYLEMNVDPTDLLWGVISLHEIYLQKPQLHVVLDKDGKINLLELVNKKEKSEQEKTGSLQVPHIRLSKFYLNDGAIFFDDYSKKEPFHIELHQISIALHDIDSDNLQEGGLHLQTKVAQSGHIEIYSNIERVEPLVVNGSFGFEIDDLSKEFAYVKESVNLHLTQGRASFFTKYHIDTNNTQKTELSHMNFSLYDIKTLANKENKEIFYLDYLYLNDIKIRPYLKEVRIPHAGIRGVTLDVQREKNGIIDWMQYLKIDDKKKKKQDDNSSNQENSKAWSVVVEDLNLEDINANFKDKAIDPPVQSSIAKLSLSAKNITLAGEDALQYSVDFTLNNKTKCNFAGSLRHASLDLKSTMECREFDIVHYRPYIQEIANKSLKKNNLLLKSLRANLLLHLNLYDENKNLYAQLYDSRIVLHALDVRKRATNENLLRINELAFDKIDIDTKQKEGSVQNIRFDKMQVAVKRYKNKKLNIEKLIIFKKSKKTKKVRQTNLKEQKAFHFVVKEFALKNARVDFYDESLEPQLKKSLSSIYVTLKNIDSKKDSWLHYRASMHFAQGKIKLNGSLRHTPLKQKGKVELQGLDLREINPYLQEQSYVKIEKGFLSFSAKESYMSRKKEADLKLQGSIALDDFLTIDTQDKNTSLLSIEKLRIKPLTFELFPNRLYIDEVMLNGFYVSAKIDENKSINFAKLMREKELSKKQKEEENEKTVQKKEDFDIKIAKLKIEKSQAFFEDLSLPIKFKTDIHSLDGVVYGISNKAGETTFVNIDGQVDKYGSTKIKGSLDSFNPKKFTDMNLEFQNLDLSAMSGYSASFAGYMIDSGKLYLDLGYQIKDAKLHASNNVVIKHIKLGKEIEGEGIKHLPLGFVLALLEDSNGIIDIDLPIEGDLDKPDFKYGKIVWNTLTNLIAKAVSSPFRFLGSMLGIDTEELGNLHFEYAKAEIAPPEREKLDTLVKIMKKRPKILISITPVYDSIADKEALQMQKLVKRVMKQSGDENIKNSKNALNIEMLEDIYSQMREDDKLSLLQEKLYKKYEDEEAFKRAYQNALIELCRDIQPVNKLELERLAKERAEGVKKYLMKKGIVLTRVVVKEIQSVKNEAKDGVEMPLSIDVQSSDK